MFTWGSHCTSLQMIHTRENLASVQNIARLLGTALNYLKFLQYFILWQFYTLLYALWKYSQLLLTLQVCKNIYPGVKLHKYNICGKDFTKHPSSGTFWSNTQMQWEWENFHLELKSQTRLHSEAESWKWTGKGFLEGSEYTRLQNISFQETIQK